MDQPEHKLIGFNPTVYGHVKRTTYVSKTDYVLWRDCAKNAWLKIHKPDVYYATDLTEFEQSIIDAGVEVEGVARGLFPGGILVLRSRLVRNVCDLAGVVGFGGRLIGNGCSYPETANQEPEASPRC